MQFRRCHSCYRNPEISAADKGILINIVGSRCAVHHCRRSRGSQRNPTNEKREVLNRSCSRVARKYSSTRDSAAQRNRRISSISESDSCQRVTSNHGNLENQRHSSRRCGSSGRVARSSHHEVTSNLGLERLRSSTDSGLQSYNDVESLRYNHVRESSVYYNRKPPMRSSGTQTENNTVRGRPSYRRHGSRGRFHTARSCCSFTGQSPLETLNAQSSVQHQSRQAEHLFAGPRRQRNGHPSVQPRREQGWHISANYRHKQNQRSSPKLQREEDGQRRVELNGFRAADQMSNEGEPNEHLSAELRSGPNGHLSVEPGEQSERALAEPRGEQSEHSLAERRAEQSEHSLVERRAEQSEHSLAERRAEQRKRTSAQAWGEENEGAATEIQDVENGHSSTCHAISAGPSSSGAAAPERIPPPKSSSDSVNVIVPPIEDQRPPPVMCRFCHQSAHDINHSVEDRNEVMCHLVRKYVCDLCGQKGKHSLKYCPFNPVTHGNPRGARMPPGPASRAHRDHVQRLINEKRAPVCPYCRKRELSSCHSLQANGVTTCPEIRKLVCPKCGQTGDQAHTVKFCPKYRHDYRQRDTRPSCPTRITDVDPVNINEKSFVTSGGNANSPSLSEEDGVHLARSIDLNVALLGSASSDKNSTSEVKSTEDVKATNGFNNVGSNEKIEMNAIIGDTNRSTGNTKPETNLVNNNKLIDNEKEATSTMGIAKSVKNGKTDAVNTLEDVRSDENGETDVIRTIENIVSVENCKTEAIDTVEHVEPAENGEPEAINVVDNVRLVEKSETKTTNTANNIRSTGNGETEAINTVDCARFFENCETATNTVHDVSSVEHSEVETIIAIDGAKSVDNYNIETIATVEKARSVETRNAETNTTECVCSAMEGNTTIRNVEQCCQPEAYIPMGSGIVAQNLLPLTVPCVDVHGLGQAYNSVPCAPHYNGDQSTTYKIFAPAPENLPYSVERASGFHTDVNPAEYAQMHYCLGNFNGYVPNFSIGASQPICGYPTYYVNDAAPIYISNSFSAPNRGRNYFPHYSSGPVISKAIPIVDPSEVASRQKSPNRGQVDTENRQDYSHSNDEQIVHEDEHLVGFAGMDSTKIGGVGNPNFSVSNEERTYREKSQVQDRIGAEETIAAYSAMANQVEGQGFSVGGSVIGDVRDENFAVETTSASTQIRTNSCVHCCAHQISSNNEPGYAESELARNSQLSNFMSLSSDSEAEDHETRSVLKVEEGESQYLSSNSRSEGIGCGGFIFGDFSPEGEEG